MRQFKTPRLHDRCAKAWALLIVYHNPITEDAPDSINSMVFNWVSRELNRMALPKGWDKFTSYPDFEKWFIDNIHH